MTKTRWLHAVSPLLPLLLIGGCPTTFDGRATDDVSLSADGSAAGSLSVDWVNGNLTILVDDQAAQVTAVGTKEVRAATDEVARQRIDDIEITLVEAESDPTQLFLRMTVPDRFLNAVYSADITVTLPAGLTMNIDHANGTVSVTGNTKATTIALANGDVTVAEHVGDLAIELANGSVDVDSTAGAVEVEVANGQVNVETRPADASDDIGITLATGSVRIRLPVDVAAALDLLTMTGDIVADLDDFDAVSDVLRETQNVTGERLTATLNGGGATVEAGVTIGDVDVDILVD